MVNAYGMKAMDGRNLRCSIIGSCQSTATSEVIKRAGPVIA